MLLLSHRGYHANAPENTIEAFAQATQLGVDGIETDLRLSRDEHLILFHDRMAPDGREVADLSHAQLTKAVTYPVPTADEAVAGFDGLLWNLEIKVPAALEASLALVRQYCSSRRRFLITSFWHNVVEEWIRRSRQDPVLSQARNLNFGLLTADRPLSLAALLGDLVPAGLSVIVWYFEILDAQLLAEARQRGIENYVYGVKTVEDHRRCLDLELDAVITDHPQMLAQAHLLHQSRATE
jgi:glycerophosphoryl diester phosphodiesterase